MMAMFARAAVVLMATTALIAASALGAASSQAAPKLKTRVFASAPAGATEPDSITLGAGSVWVSYAGGTTPDGSEPTGNSTVVRYGMDGAVQKTYSIKGSVDGLKFNPGDNTIWALQNQDSNSALSIINPATDTVTPMTYAVVSKTQGYDDVVFRGKDIFLSFTNPAKPTDVTIAKVVPGTSPIQVTPVLTAGAAGANMAAKAGDMVPKVFDPDSLKLAPNGDLVQTSGDRNTLVFVSNPGEAGQKIGYLPLVGPHKAKIEGVDDSLFVTAPAGKLFFTATKGNKVMVAELTGASPGTLLANVGSLGGVGLVDMKTGVVTPLVTGIKGPHGMAFADSP